MKNQAQNAILTSEMRWDLMNQNVLISTAMISALWERHNKDSLDLMLPFLKYAICKTTKVGKKLNIDAVMDVFKKEFGYDTIPQNVIIVMLNRLSPTPLVRKDREYILSVSLDDEYAEFEKRRILYKERRNLVGNALANYLNESILYLSEQYTTESASLALIAFFIANGLVFAQTPEQLSLLKKEKDGKINYCIARFLINEHRSKSAIFDYVTDIVKGFFVSTAISFQPENISMPHSKLKNLRCYLDTRVILSTLGLRQVSAQKAAQELLEMLRGEQAVICCFEHTVTEIRDIIRAYKNNLLNPNSKTVHNTLERWDEERYSVAQVSRYLSVLDKKIQDLGIAIVPSPVDLNAKVKGLNCYKFKEQLKKRVLYNSSAAWENDVLSVLGVMRFRKGRSSPEFEKSGHIFITTNIPLIEVVNNCLWEVDAGIGPVMADTTLSSVVWLKCSSTHKDYPAHKLVENAMLALEPSHSFLKDFYEVINQLQAEGGVSEEEAAIIRTDIQIKRELVSVVGGDSHRINKDVVNEMRERLRERYIGENKKLSEENYQRYLAQKSHNDKALQQIILEIEDAGERCFQCVKNILSMIACVALIIILILLIGLSVAGFIVSRNYWIGAVVMLITDAFGFYDLLLGRKQIIRKAINKISGWFAEKARNKKRNEGVN